MTRAKCCEKCANDTGLHKIPCECHTTKTVRAIPEWDVETLSAKLHDIYQKEAHRQEDAGIGNARHYDEYEKLSEPVKEFDRVLARFIISLLTTREAEVTEKIIREIDDGVRSSLSPGKWFKNYALYNGVNLTTNPKGTEREKLCRCGRKVCWPESNIVCASFPFCVENTTTNQTNATTK